MSREHPWNTQNQQWLPHPGSIQVFDPSTFNNGSGQEMQMPTLQTAAEPMQGYFQEPQMQAMGEGYSQNWGYPVAQASDYGHVTGHPDFQYSGLAPDQRQWPTEMGTNTDYGMHYADGGQTGYGGEWGTGDLTQQGYIYNDGYVEQPIGFTDESMRFASQDEFVPGVLEDFNQNFNNAPPDVIRSSSLQSTDDGGVRSEVNGDKPFYASDTRMRNVVEETVEDSAILNDFIEPVTSFLPASNSFANLPHHPSPFDDEIIALNDDFTEKDRLSLSASTSHSRQSSCGEARFVVGSMEHIPGQGNATTDQMQAGQKDGQEESVEFETSSRLSMGEDGEIQDHRVKDMHTDGGPTSAVVHQESSQIPPSEDLSLPHPPPSSLMMRPVGMAGGTMAGTPARNQFRKFPDGKSSSAKKSKNLAPPSKHFNPLGAEGYDSSSHVPPQYTGSSGVAAAAAAGPDESTVTPLNVDSNAMRGTRLFEDGGTSANAETVHNDEGDRGQSHQLDIYSTSITPHPNSSFVPVGHGASSVNNPTSWPVESQPTEELGDDASSSRVENFPQPDPDMEPSLPPLDVSSGLPYPVKSKEPAVHQNPAEGSGGGGAEGGSGTGGGETSGGGGGGGGTGGGISREIVDVNSHLQSMLHRHNPERTVSPATTLWENPAPGIGICLLPAAGNKEEGDHHHQHQHPPHPSDASKISPRVSHTSGTAEQPQNTGTGPGAKQTGLLISQGQNAQQSGGGASFNATPSGVTTDHFAFPLTGNQNQPPHHNPGGIGDSAEGAAIGGPNRGVTGGDDSPPKTSAPLFFIEGGPLRNVVHVRNESIDSLSDEIAKSRDPSRSTEGGKASHGKRTTEELRNREENPRQTKAIGGHDTLIDRDSRKPSIGEDVNVQQLDFNSSQSTTQRLDISTRHGQGEHNNPGGRTEMESKATERSQNNRDGKARSSDAVTTQRSDSHRGKSGMEVPRNPMQEKSVSDQRSYGPPPRVDGGGRRDGYSDDSRSRSRQGYQEPYQRPNSRHGYPQDPYGYQPEHQDRPHSRQGYPPEATDRPRSRQGYPPEATDRPRSRQGYPPEAVDRQRYPPEATDRPRSRQGYPPEAVDRQGYPPEAVDKQGYPPEATDRPRSRQGCPPEAADRPRSRQGYPPEATDRPRSRQGYPPEPYYDRPRSRQGYPDELSYDRPKEPYDRPRYRDDQSDRPRSRQGYPEAIPGDPRMRKGYSEEGYYDRPHSRQDYDGDRRGGAYREADYDDYRSRRGHDYSIRPGYSDENYSRPRSRQNESETNLSYEDSERLRTHSRNPSERSRSDYDRGRERNRDSYDYDDYYRNYYKDYYDYYYRQQGRYQQQQQQQQQYNPYYYAGNPYDKGYYDEMVQYGQMQPYDPRYGYTDPYGKPLETHLEGSSPGHDQLSTGADNFAREYHEGSRPGSRTSFSELGQLSGVPSQSGLSQHSQDPYDQTYPYHDQFLYQEPCPPKQSQRMTPQKFIIPHTRASFGPTGQLVHILPNSPLDGQPATVELIDVASLLTGSREMDELKRFPGPLVRHETHKTDVLQYCQKMAEECRNNGSLVDRESAELLWQFLELLIKQNGTIIGTDVADLLLDKHEPTSSCYAKTGLRIACSREELDVDEDGLSVTADQTVVRKESIDVGLDEATDRFRHLLLHGHKKDALEWAMKKNLWGHALFLASKMDAKTHASIMTRFANVSMKMNDPLQTLYQIMSGRQPAAVTLIADEKWGDWRPHLSIILSNPTQKADLDKKSIVTLGDTLACRGFLFGAQLCYLMAQVPFGHFNKKSSKIVLVGASHSSPFVEFASNFAIQFTECYEYGISLGNIKPSFPTFQIYKFVYLLRLLDYGFVEEALKYCEVIANNVVQSPHLYPATLAKALCNVAYGLRFSDSQRLLMEESEDVAWFKSLQRVIQMIDDGTIQHVSGQETPIGGLSTGASSEVAEILGGGGGGGQPHPQQEFSSQYGSDVNFTAYQGGLGQWSSGDMQQQQQQQQMAWNPAAQASQHQYYQTDPSQLQPQWQPQQQQQPGSWYPSGQFADNTSNENDSNVIGLQPGAIDQTDARNLQTDISNDATGNTFQNQQTTMNAPPPFESSIPAHMRFSGHERQRTISTGSTHSQQHVSSRRTSSSTVHGATPPDTPGHQTSGTTMPLGVNQSETKKKQVYPGDELDDDNISKGKARGHQKNAGKSFFSRLFNRNAGPKAKEMNLPDDKNPKIIWDKEKQRWINTEEDADESERISKPPPPPKDEDVSQLLATPILAPLSKSPINKFSLQKSRGARGQYVDILSGSSKPSPMAPNSLLSMLPKSQSMPPSFFIPNARAAAAEDIHQSDSIAATTATPEASASSSAIASDRQLEHIEEQHMQQQQPMQQQQQPMQQQQQPMQQQQQPMQQQQQQMQQQQMMQPQHQFQADPQISTSNNSSSEDATSSIPMMFNPALFSHSMSTPSVPATQAPIANSHIKYGQRRVYPKK